MERSRSRSKVKMEGFHFKCLDRMIKKYRQAKKAMDCCAPVASSSHSSHSVDRAYSKAKKATEVLFMNDHFKQAEEQRVALDPADGGDQKPENDGGDQKPENDGGDQKPENDGGDQKPENDIKPSLADDAIEASGDPEIKNATEVTILNDTVGDTAAEHVETGPSADSGEIQLQNAAKDTFLNEATGAATAQHASDQPVDCGDPKPVDGTKPPMADDSICEVSKGMVVVKIGYYNMLCAMVPLVKKVAFFKHRKRQQIIRLLGDYVTPYAFTTVYDWALCGKANEVGERFIEVYRAASYLGVSDDFWSPFVKKVLTENAKKAEEEFSDN